MTFIRLALSMSRPIHKLEIEKKIAFLKATQYLAVVEKGYKNNLIPMDCDSLCTL